MKYIFILIISALLNITTTTNAQNWTEPVQISALQGINHYPDFCIDKNGTIHCVWSYKVESNYWHIYYSKSTDDGLTWSIPENVSQNTSMWMEEPHIVADSENNLHLTYDFNTGDYYHTLVVHREFDGNNWSEEDTVSTGWPGSMHNRLVIDNNDKLYCFWYHPYQNGTIFYRILENEQWGVISVIYDNNDLTVFMRGVVDSSNNIRCTGIHHYQGQSGYDDRIITFDFINGEWTDWVQLSDNTSWGGNDIAIDSNNNPKIVWRQEIDDSIPPNHGTLYAEFNDENWTAPMLIAENGSDQAIAVDVNNIVHIIDNEQTEDGYRLLHYRYIDNEWVGEIIEEDTFGNYGNKLINRENYLYLVSAKAYSSSPNPDIPIVLRKYEITTSIENTIKPVFSAYNIYPNPSSGNTTISYSIQEENKQTSIKIYDLQGKLINTILNETQPPGEYQIVWNGTGKNGKEVNSGLYLIRLQAGRQIMTRSVEIIK